MQGREGGATYLTAWNLLEDVSSILVAFGSACQLANVTDGVRTAGALGVALKCFGLVDFLRSFPATGSLVRMITVRAPDALRVSLC